MNDLFYLYTKDEKPKKPRPFRAGLPKLENFIFSKARSGGLLQFYGESGSGKTQLLFSVVANTLGHEVRILFFDTQYKFRPERIEQMMQSSSFNSDALDSVHVFRSGDPYKIYETALSAISNDGYDYLIFDDLSEPFLREGYSSKESSMLSLLGRKLNIWGVARGRFVLASQRISFNPIYQKDLPLGQEFLTPYTMLQFRLVKLPAYHCIKADGSEVCRFLIRERGLIEI